MCKSHSTLKEEHDQLKKSVADVTEGINFSLLIKNKNFAGNNLDRTALRDALERLTNEAREKEETLLSKFLVILNAKKAEICRLKEECKN
jgi:hypothetical protein